MGTLFDESNENNIDNRSTPNNSQNQTSQDHNFFTDSDNQYDLHLDQDINNPANENDQPNNEESSLPTTNDNHNLPLISGLRIQDTPCDEPVLNESADHRIDSQIDSNEILSSPDLLLSQSTPNNHDHTSRTSSPTPGPSTSSQQSSPKTSTTKKTKASNKQPTPEITNEPHSLPNSQPHQIPRDAIEDNITSNNPRQFPVIQSNDPPSQTFSQDVFDEFNSSDLQ